MTFTETDHIHASEIGYPVFPRSAIVRLDTLSESGVTVDPRLYTNDSHHALGVDEAGVGIGWDKTNRPLRITCPNLGPVLSIQVTPDETLMARGIMAGPSGGGGVTDIYLGKYAIEDGVLVVKPVKVTDKATLYNEYANLWIQWLICGCEAVQAS